MLVCWSCEFLILISFPHIVILNLFQDNKPPSRVILKQVQDDEGFWKGEENGAPGAIRTPGPQIRSLMLYPAELRVHGEALLVVRP